jgi:hypothetical protein
MPLHDWTERGGWEGVHHVWITELLRWVKPRLPEGYRAYIGSVPTIAVGAPSERPDVAVRQWPETPPAAGGNGAGQTAEGDEPDEEIAVATLDPAKALYVEMSGRLVAAVELISPRNQDRTLSRTTYLARYVGYLLEGVHLLLVDVHRRPLNFSFADRIAEELNIRQPPCPPPMAVSYRVGGPAATGGRILGIWRRPLTVGAPLPALKLALSPDLAVTIDLEQTYAQACADAYLS